MSQVGSGLHPSYSNTRSLTLHTFFHPSRIMKTFTAKPSRNGPTLTSLNHALKCLVRSNVQSAQKYITLKCAVRSEVLRAQMSCPLKSLVRSSVLSAQKSLRSNVLFAQMIPHHPLHSHWRVHDHCVRGCTNPIHAPTERQHAANVETAWKH